MRKSLCALAVAAAFALPAFAVDLTEALRAAELSDPTLAAASANRDAAVENIAIARSRLLPQINVQSTVQTLNQVTTGALGTSKFDGPSRSASLQVRQGLFRPRDWRGLGVGKAQAEFGEYKLASATSDLWQRAATAWIDVLASTAVRDAYRLPVASAESAAQQEKRRLQLGDGTRDAAAEAAAQLVDARAQLLNAETDLLAKQQAFRLLTRLEPSGFDKLRVPALDRLPVALPSEEEALLRIIDTNGELLALRAAETVAQRRLHQASADHLPTLDLLGSKTNAQNDSTNTLGTRYRNEQIGLQLQVPIYSGGGVKAVERQMAAQYAAAAAERNAMEQKVRTQVSADFQLLRGLRERLQSAQELRSASLEQKRGAELALRGGLKTWSDVHAAEQAIARRSADVIGLATAVLKVQVRLLAMLPVTDPAWSQWTGQVSAAVR